MPKFPKDKLFMPFIVCCFVCFFVTFFPSLFLLCLLYGFRVIPPPLNGYNIYKSLISIVSWYNNIRFNSLSIHEWSLCPEERGGLHYPTGIRTSMIPNALIYKCSQLVACHGPTRSWSGAICVMISYKHLLSHHNYMSFTNFSVP